MFRFATYGKLGTHILFLVGKNGTEHQLKVGSIAELNFYFIQKQALGFYFRFSDKYHPLAYAFFCELSNVSDFWSRFCPVKVLFQLAHNHLLKVNIFPDAIIKSKTLGNFLRFAARRSGCLGGHLFTPHSLRIGGHTFFSIKNMDPDFLHFLGRRAINRSCQLYYRANAFDNIARLHMFFRSISSLHILEKAGPSVFWELSMKVTRCYTKLISNLGLHSGIRE